jgi:hypothetical protein
MRIFQIKYNNGIYAYYMVANDKKNITPETKYYRSYIDCGKQESGHLDTFEQARIYSALYKFFLDAE